MEREMNTPTWNWTDQEIRQYMASYGVDYAKAKLDVMDEYNQTPSDVDAFYDRMEAQS
jgi:hypothetical protein